MRKYTVTEDEVRLVLQADAPPIDYSEFYAKLYEEHTRPAALAEIAKRGIDVEAVRARICDYIVELGKLPEFEVNMIAILNDDAGGLWIVALRLLDGTFDKPGARACYRETASQCRS